MAPVVGPSSVPKQRRPVRLGVILGMVVAVGVASLFVAASWKVFRGRRPATAVLVEVQPEPDSERVPPSLLAPARVALGAPSHEVALPAPRTADTEPPHPHPLTAQHQRLFRENNLIGSLMGAADLRDHVGLRRLLRQYSEEFPEDDQMLQEGYALIADCLAARTPGTTAQARRFNETMIASPARRYVLRYCLE